MQRNSLPKISIIVPVHNAGERLVKCLDTLINQTLHEIEIILVLDCPTDGSDKVAKEYAAKDERIIILENSENLHIGETRNRGLEIARGEYIGFSDHDDYRELTMYEELYGRALDENADIVLSLLENKDDVEKMEKKFGDAIFSKTFLLKDLIGFGYQDNPGALFVRVNNNLYKRELLQMHKIKFVDTKEITPEDVIFQIKNIYFASKTAFVKRQFYFHIKHSANEGKKYSYVGYKKRSAGIHEIFKFLNAVETYEFYKSDFLYGVTKQYINSLVGTVCPLPNIYAYVKAVKHLRAYPYCKEAFENYSLPPVKYNFFRKILVASLR